MRPIDADALIPMMKYATTDSEIGVFPIKIGFNDIKKVIDEQSTIEPQRKKGEWTVKEGDLAFWDVCSVCRKVVIHMVPHYNFCPNCGADMRGEQE